MTITTKSSPVGDDIHDDAERLRRISAWSHASARILAPARPQQPGQLHRCSIGSGDIEAILDGLERIGPELSALAARLDAAAGTRPELIAGGHSVEG